MLTEINVNFLGRDNGSFRSYDYNLAFIELTVSGHSSNTLNLIEVFLTGPGSGVRGPGGNICFSMSRVFEQQTYKNIFLQVLQWKPLNVITLGPHIFDHINKMITLTVNFHDVVICTEREI